VTYTVTRLCLFFQNLHFFKNISIYLRKISSKSIFEKNSGGSFFNSFFFIFRYNFLSFSCTNLQYNEARKTWFFISKRRRRNTRKNSQESFFFSLLKTQKCSRNLYIEERCASRKNSKVFFLKLGAAAADVHAICVMRRTNPRLNKKESVKFLKCRFFSKN